MVEFAVEWLTGLFGTNVKKAVQRTQTTNGTRILGRSVRSRPVVARRESARQS